MSEALENGKHERFAQEMANGKATGEAYSIAYGTKGMTSSVNANRLLKNANILARIANLKAGNAEKCQMTREELLRIMVDTVKAKPIDASMHNPLCELKMSKTGPFAAFMDKTRAAERICKMLGWDAPEKIDATTNGESINTVPAVTFLLPASFVQRRGQHASSN